MQQISNPIEICNLALTKINQNTISSIDNNSPQGQTVGLVYDQSRKSLLAQYNWTFAIKTQKLIKDSGIENVEYNNTFYIPNDFLRLIHLYDGKSPVINTNTRMPKFVFENSHIYTNIEDCTIKYVYNNDNVLSFPPLFIDCFVLDLCLRTTKLFNDSTTYLQQLTNEFNIALEKAKICDCQQTTIAGISYYPLSDSYIGI